MPTGQLQSFSDHLAEKDAVGGSCRGRASQSSGGGSRQQDGRAALGHGHRQGVGGGTVVLPILAVVLTM